MNLRTIVWKEMRERPTAMFVSLLAVMLSVTALVAIRNVAVFSEIEVADKLDKLGANVLILPKEASLQDYYAADMQSETIPEEIVSELVFAQMTGVEAIAPKLCIPATIHDQKTTLTGILPQSEIQKMASWQGGVLFKKHEGCKAKINLANEKDDSPEALAKRRTLQNLGDKDVILGAEYAEATGLKQGDKIQILGEEFSVLTVLDATGTVDDSRVFAHLHNVQDLSKSGEVVNVIEVMGCCKDVANGLIGKLQSLLPDTKIMTIANVVKTQISVNQMMTNISYMFLTILVVIGGASMASSTFSNVIERRREIGTLMALGASPKFVTNLFLVKAVLLGLAGGIGGYVLGSVLAYFLGPYFADISVYPLPSLMLIATGTAVFVTLIASYIPARRAANLDPCICFKEV